MSKIETITKAISEIRNALGAECANISELPTLVGGVVNNMGGSGYTTSFAFSSENSPKTPTASVLDINSGLVLELDEEWSQTGFRSNTRNISDSAPKWVSFAVFGPTGYIVSDWSEPVNIKGTDGKQGVDGAIGPQGPIGPEGPVGAVGPQGIQGPAGPKGDKGDPGPQGEPGKDGADGIDGSVYEYVYFRGITADDKPPKPSGGNSTNDFKPTYTKTVYVNGNPYVLEWTDKAQGVDEVYKFEWQSERKKETTSTWGNFTEPILWAKYGEKGKDGDGVQYIFTTTNVNQAPKNPIVNLPNYETDSDYQNTEGDEYIPSTEVSGGQVWEDNPIELDGDTKKYCWVSIRKYRNGKWKKYSDPTLWTKWVESSGTITGDILVFDVDPDWIMINEDESEVKTTVRVFRGDDPVVITSVTDASDFEDVPYTFSASSDESNTEWTVTISDINSSDSTIPVKLNITLSDSVSRTKTFTIYQTKADSETVSVDFGDDNILVPCSDGSNPDEGFFNDLEIPVIMRVAGQLVTVTSITPDKNPESFEMTSAGNIKVKSFPGSAQKTSVKFTVSDGTNTAEGYVNFTKFNTAGGTIAMYTLNINANDIVCDTRNNINEYKVYSGKQGVSDNKIKVLVNKYSSKEGNSVIEVSALPSNYAVYYANDPEDWSEDASSTLGEYLPITNNGIEIGKDISPDKCVSFQLREWVGEGTPWSDMSEDNYKVWDSENILVDIIRDIASYQFVVTPNKIHRNVNGEIVIPENQEITIGLSKNIAGDGVADYEALSMIPTGYDIYYEKDNNGNPDPIGGESENVTLPFKLNVSDVTNSIVLTLVVNENSEDDGQVVLSETIEITSDVPGESAYVGYLTDSLGVVSCDANENPTAGQEFETTFKVTNGEVTSIDPISGVGFTAEISGDTIVFKNFTRDLPETTKLTISAEYRAKDGTVGKEESTYTIVKLRVADASTILDFANDNIIIPCDENNSPLVDSVSTFVAMMHGSTKLFLSTTDTNVELGSRTEEGYYPISLALDRVKFDGNGVCNYNIPFTGTDSDGNTYDRTGQLILTKLKAGESGEIWDLVLNADTPKWNNDSDKFDDDYIEGWVNIWGADKWDIASYNTLAGAERYIVCKTNKETTTYVPLTSDDFADNGHFKIYINPQNKPENAIYLDIDKSDGAKIALAKKENDQYIPIQEEIIRASFDGRDFSKFELVLSDGAIYQTYKDGAQTTVTPNEIKVLGVFEHDGPNRTKYEGTLHAQHIAGLDIYYTIDSETYSEFNEEMIEFPDTGNDGWANNDKLPITVGDITERLDVYLVAHYNVPGDNSEETVYQIVDHKELLVVPIDLPGDVEIAHLELSQDEVKVPIDEKGDVDPDFKVSITPYVYVNDDLNNDPVEYVFGGETQPTTGWTNNKSEFTASDFGNNHSYIWFRCESRKLYKKCKITKELNPVEIFIDRTVVKRDLSTNKVDDTVTIEIKKWNYNSNVWESATGYDVIMKYTTVEDANEKSDIINNSDNKYVAPLNTYYGINYIKFVISKDGIEKGFEEVGVITDGMDGSSREVIYYKSSTEGAPKNPTPEITSGAYQNDDTTPLDWFNAGAYQNMTEEEAAKWVDEYPGVNDTDCKYVYVSERKRARGANSEWGSFSQPHLYAKNVVDGTPGENAWSWRLSDPIEMISYNSDGTPNGSINASTTVLASCGGHIADVQITKVSVDFGSYNGDTFTFDSLPADGSNFTIMITAEGTWGDYTDEAELRYTVKKWYGEPATVQVHLSNDSSPITTDSNGNYPDDVTRTVELTASSGKTNIAITNITTSNTTIGLDWTDAPELKITVPTNATGWSNDDVLTVPLVCTLADGYDPQTVIMSFYKVRAAKDAEYPDVYDLLVNPTSILVGVNQETGEANYETTTVTPTIIKYTATNETKVLSVSDFNALNVGSIKYSFDGYGVNTLEGDDFTIAGNNYANEYVDVVMEITGGKTQTERILISHDPIPNIDWELELNCPERILYKSDKTTQITDVKNVACRLYKTVGGVRNYVSTIQEHFGFTLEWYLDGVQQESPYTIDDVIELDAFTNSCEFVLVNQGGEGEEDVIWDRKLVTKEYAEAGPQGNAGESTLVYDFTNNHIPVVPHMTDYGLGNGVGTEIHVYYGLIELPLEVHNNRETNDDNKRIVVEYNGEVILADNGSFHWGFNEGTKTFSFGAGLVDWLMAKDAKAEYWKLDITVQVTVGGETKKLTKGLYLYKAESLRPKLSIAPSVIKVGETTELTIHVLGADNKWADEWYNDGYTIKINDNPWNPSSNLETYPVGDIPLDIVLYKDGEFADAETIPVLRDGKSKLSPIIYPAGEFKLGVQYEGTAIKAPYVLYEGTYYIAYGKPNTEENAGDTLIDDPDWSNIPEGQGEGGWIKMDTFEAIYADIGIIKEALVGPLVFHGNYVFSQDGKGTNNDSLTNYEKALAAFPGQTISAIIDNKNWIPNLLFNAKTGTGHFAKGKIQWTEDTITIDGVPVVTEGDTEDKYAVLTMKEKDVFTLYWDDNNDNSYYIHAEMPFEASAITATSDMTLKDVVKDVELTVDDLANAPTFVFDWKDGSGRSVGTSAQYWQDVLPEAVVNGKNLSLAYGNVALVGMSSLARRVREQDKEIAELKTLVNELVNKLS